MTALSLTTEADAALYASLSPAAEKDLHEWLDDCRAIHAAGHGQKGPVRQRIAARRGLQEGAVRARFAQWERDGWRGLINKTRARGHTLPRAFVEREWLTLLDSHSRSKTTTTQAWRMLLAKLEAWEKEGGCAGSKYTLCGYDSPPRRLASTGLPAGWSKTTLSQLAKKAKASRKLRNHGALAFAGMLPEVHATRIGSEVGSIYFFDDEEPDVEVNFIGNGRSCRPLAFHCLDFHSGCNIRRGFRPTIYRQDGTKSKLSETDFFWFVLGVLTIDGYRPGGTILWGERGTAHLPDAKVFGGGMSAAEAIAAATGGAVTWNQSGRHGDPAILGALYEEASHGNFKAKAPIESWFNLERNYMAALPGPTGRNYMEKPGEIVGRNRENRGFLQLLERMPLERRALMRSPVMEWNVFSQTANEIVRIINDRTDHNLTDYLALGYTESVIRIGPQEIVCTPAMLAKMSPEDAAGLRALAKAGTTAARMLSPRAVWDMGAPRLRKLSGAQQAAIMPYDCGQEKKVSDRWQFEITDAAVSPELMRFPARVQDHRGLVINLDRGAKYRVYLNPFAPHILQVCDLKNAWIGETYQLERVDKTKPEQLAGMYGKIQGLASAEMADIEARMSHEVARRKTTHAVNKRVGDLSRPLTDGEHAAAAALAGAVEAMAADAPGAGLIGDGGTESAPDFAAFD